MPDIPTPQQRHRCMSHIRSKGTKPELAVRKWLWVHGYRYLPAEDFMTWGELVDRKK